MISPSNATQEGLDDTLPGSEHQPLMLSVSVSAATLAKWSTLIVSNPGNISVTKCLNGVFIA
jgi:hypothetical protein